MSKYFRTYWYFFIIAIICLITILPGNIPTILGIFQDASAHANLLGAEIGGFLAGLVAIFTVDRQNNLAKQREKEKVDANRTAFLKLIKAELSVLSERYMEVIGNDVESFRGEFFSGGFFRSHHGYFTSFDMNADKLGFLGEESSILIIKTYINFKALFDRWVAYGDLVVNYEYSQKVAQTPVMHKVELSRLFNSIKEDQKKTTILTTETLSLLDKLIKG